jgi:hypothetical protein
MAFGKSTIQGSAGSSGSLPRMASLRASFVLICFFPFLVSGTIFQGGWLCFSMVRFSPHELQQVAWASMLLVARRPVEELGSHHLDGLVHEVLVVDLSVVASEGHGTEHEVRPRPGGYGARRQRSRSLPPRVFEPSL